MKKQKLKLKSLIYRFTGLYLAQAEENEYMASVEAYKKVRGLNKKDVGLPLNSARKLVIGLWQADNRFVREYQKNAYINMVLYNFIIVGSAVVIAFIFNEILT